MKKLPLASPITSLDDGSLDEQIQAAERKLARRPHGLPEALNVLPFVPTHKDRRTGQEIDPLNPPVVRRERRHTLDNQETALPQRLQFALHKLAH